MPNPLDTAPAVWDPATGRVYTLLVPDPSGGLVCAFSRETFAQALTTGRISKDARILPQDEAFALMAAADRSRYCRGPETITAERFDEMLNMLPPAKWQHSPGAESFMIPEAIAGSLHTFGVRIGSDFYAITEDCRISHADLVAACLNAKTNLTA